MRLPRDWTQFHALRLPGDRVEVSIHLKGPWLLTAVGDSLEHAVMNARCSPPIAMGVDAPMLCDAARIYGDDEQGGAA